MDFSLTPDQQNIREAILKLCSRFPDEYWLEHDRSSVFPNEFYQSLLESGWLGVAMPTEYGGSGLGGVIGLIVVVLVVIWLAGGLHGLTFGHT